MFSVVILYYENTVCCPNSSVGKMFVESHGVYQKAGKALPYFFETDLKFNIAIL